MTRFTIELSGPAPDALANPGIAQARVLVGLEAEIAAVIKKAASLGITLADRTRFVAEHRTKAPPADTRVTEAPGVDGAAALAVAGEQQPRRPHRAVPEAAE